MSEVLAGTMTVVDESDENFGLSFTPMEVSQLQGRCRPQRETIPPAHVAHGPRPNCSLDIPWELQWENDEDVVEYREVQMYLRCTPQRSLQEFYAQTARDAAQEHAENEGVLNHNRVLTVH